MIEKLKNRLSKTDLVAIVILLFSLLIRLWQLNSVPLSLFGDELDVGNQAKSILQTGKDYMGNSYPIYFQSFAEFRLPMQLYAAVPTIALFGSNEWGVRLPAVIFGMASLIGFYLLIKEIFNKKLALIGLIFLAISPWHFMYSRQANDAGMLPPFIIFGTLFFLKGRKNYRSLFISAALFAISLYSYATSSVFAPVYVLFLVLLYRKEILSYSINRLIVVVLFGLILSAPFVWETVKGSTTARFSYIGILSDDKVAELILSNRRWSDSELAKLLYNNKTIEYNEILRNYVNSFSVSYLFVDGDPNLRQSIGLFGEMYQFDLVFIAAGIWYIVAKYKDMDEEKKKLVKVFGFWLLFAPVPSALTGGGGNHASRLIIMLFPLVLISASGALKVYQYVLKNRQYVLGGVVVALMVFNIAYHFQRYFIVWPGNSWRFWHYGYKEALTYANEVDGQYEQVFFNNTYEPMLPRFLFWYDYNMSNFHQEFTDDKQIDMIIDGYNGFKLGEKFYFGELIGVTEEFVNSERLIVASAEREISNPAILKDPRIDLLKTVNDPFGEPIFYIFTGTQDPN